MLALSTLSMSATENAAKADTTVTVYPSEDESLTMPLKPTYLRNSVVGAGWDSNWFIVTKGGATAFIGTPIGCGDIFERTTPTLQVGIGKWFTPYVGGRIEYQGLEFKNSDLHNMKYDFIHADFMYNITGMLGMNEQGLSKWSIVPFVGVGMIYSSDWRNDCTCGNVMSNSHPFAFSYGVQIGYRLSNRVHLLAEVSGMTTAKSFDMNGISSKFGDNMLNVSAGLSITLGKSGWKKVTDARPYINQNNYLMDQIGALRNQKSKEPIGNCTVNGNAKNNYGGLNSLKFRMSLSGGDKDNVNDSISNSNAPSSTSVPSVDTPVYFYFKIGTTDLVDKSQLANLTELAKLAKEHNLHINIQGAADSATGSSGKNRSLSTDRARYIARELINRGISKDMIQTTSLGGINDFEPKEANRYTMVVLIK